MLPTRVADVASPRNGLLGEQVWALRPPPFLLLFEPPPQQALSTTAVTTVAIARARRIELGMAGNLPDDRMSCRGGIVGSGRARRRYRLPRVSPCVRIWQRLPGRAAPASRRTR